MVTVTPLPGKTFGARVTNVRLASLSPAEIAQLKAAFLKHGLLIFPDQKITPAEQAKFGRLFGRIEVIAPGMDAVPISNKKPDGTLLGEEEHARKILEGNEGWHSDSGFS